MLTDKELAQLDRNFIGNASGVYLLHDPAAVDPVRPVGEPFKRTEGLRFYVFARGEASPLFIRARIPRHHLPAKLNTKADRLEVEGSSWQIVELETRPNGQAVFKAEEVDDD